jgi:hypothetical protein
MIVLVFKFTGLHGFKKPNCNAPKLTATATIVPIINWGIVWSRILNLAQEIRGIANRRKR